MASSTVQSVHTTTTTTATDSPNSTALSHQTPNQDNSHISSSSTIQPHHITNNSISSSSFNPKKRALDHVGLLQSSPYFKMRALLKELRPLFLEVIRAPDIQNCAAGRGIQEKMKVMIDLCRQKTVEKHGGQQNPALMSRDMKPTDEPPQLDRSFPKSAEEKRFPIGNNLEKQTTHESSRIPGTYIVGGSAFGWNFITFHGTKPEYYGRTKQAFRAGN